MVKIYKDVLQNSVNTKARYGNDAKNTSFPHLALFHFLRNIYVYKKTVITLTFAFLCSFKLIF